MSDFDLKFIQVFKFSELQHVQIPFIISILMDIKFSWIEPFQF